MEQIDYERFQRTINKTINSPLLAVPLNAKIERFSKFVFSTDYREADVVAIASIIEIAQFYEASVDIVHILNKEQSKKVNNQNLLDNLKSELMKTTDYSKLDFELLYGEDVHNRLQILMKEMHQGYQILKIFERKCFTL